MSDVTFACRFVIWKDAKLIHRRFDLADDGVSPFILNHAVGDRNDFVAPFFIEAIDDMPIPIQSERHLNLVAVIIRIIHPDRLFGIDV